jgi:hypothetical protein
MPINPYTGEEIVDAYTPYSTESGATPLVRKLTPEKFGSSPGFEPTFTPIPRPEPTPPRPPRPPFVTPPPPVVPPTTPPPPPVVPPTTPPVVPPTTPPVVPPTTPPLRPPVLPPWKQPPVRRNFYKEIFAPTSPPIDPAISEMLNLRQEATDATNNATDQYEADVADYKNILASEAEQGIGSLPEYDESRKYFSDNTFQPNSQAADMITGSGQISNDPFASSPLNSGISNLPSNQQNDTLTTQVFQSGFRPNRKGRR